MRFLSGRLTSTPKSPSEPPSSALPQPPPAAAEVKPLSETEEEEEEEEEGEDEEDAGRGRRRENGEGGGRSPVCGSAPTTSAGTSPSATINLSREYTLAIQTNSYNEIWSKIHDGEEEGEGEGGDGVGRVLQPHRASIEKVLGSAPPTHFARIVSDYLDSSEHTCRLCLSLRRAVESGRSLYRPIRDLLELLPAGRGLDPHLTQAQCDWAFDTFLQFDRLDNPFPDPSTSFHFQGTRGCFRELKQQLDRRLLKARRRNRCTTWASAVCLVGRTAALVLAGPASCLLGPGRGPGPGRCGCCCGGGGDLLGHPRWQLREHMDQLDAAARGTYVLHHDLDTIERLAARLHATVESDKMLVRLGLERGRGQRHPIEEVLRHLRKTHPSFRHQLADLDEHICLYLAAINRASSLLLGQIHRHHCRHLTT
ncbi:UPF0496 protein [Ananas comosus]|uniref:UPF0496 protein n=1 Tax=Ananas comosus TaxID=4615 RepID=A0A199VAF6_ANACO|nr:UPF0496 protein [Ananas comosus]